LYGSRPNEYINYKHFKTQKILLSSGLPDGIFSYQKSQFRYILEGLGMKNIGKFYGQL
jgi:hypothetical protein